MQYEKTDVYLTFCITCTFISCNFLYRLQGSGVVKAGPGRARAGPKFVLLMCAQALVLLAQWLSVQQVPSQYQ